MHNIIFFLFVFEKYFAFCFVFFLFCSCSRYFALNSFLPSSAFFFSFCSTSTFLMIIGMCSVSFLIIRRLFAFYKKQKELPCFGCFIFPRIILFFRMLKFSELSSKSHCSQAFLFPIIPNCYHRAIFVSYD